MTQQKLRDFFEARPALSRRMLETEAAIPSHTLQKFTQGRDFPEKHWPALVEVLKKYGWK